MKRQKAVSAKVWVLPLVLGLALTGASLTIRLTQAVWLPAVLEQLVPQDQRPLPGANVCSLVPKSYDGLPFAYVASYDCSEDLGISVNPNSFDPAGFGLDVVLFSLIAGGVMYGWRKRRARH